MGNTIEKCHILVLGMPGAGKTHFISILQFQDCFTYLGPTHGVHQGTYKHNDTLMHFTEFGGRNKRIWNIMMEERIIDAVYYFIHADDIDSSSCILKGWTHVLQLLSKQLIPKHVPIVCVVYVPKEGVYNYTRLEKCLQLHLLKNRPRLVTQLHLYDRARLNTAIDHLLDWTVCKTRQ